jgi:D-serine deaminase-like pyridoxal phosphate-dependent protein
MEHLRTAHDAVGGEVVSAGATVTYDINTYATEIQAGTYVLMDTAFERFGTPFRRALFVWATVVSVLPDWAVADCGLKSLGMDHGEPTVDGGDVLVCSDEHITFVPHAGNSVAVGDKIKVWPAHLDPTVAYHEWMHVADGDEIVERWPVDLRGW